eukprot:CAMPEP_0119018442 /NCGR_PEP_ID=MMETSP1176-20130426/19429_1 /TAXON_ID=265551 /ORGANISM="Synedropsis recta cf, Strain CCMP1620" /LENGTH=253 /DNA_ID=CAMNT_0006972449 /DNA_START=39 /DNA_END=800 /DNA_ORIENTATION=+
MASTTKAFTTLQPSTRRTYTTRIVSQVRGGVEKQISSIPLGMTGNNDLEKDSRRLFLCTGLTLLLSPNAALAGIDISSLKNLPVEGDQSGAATRLKQLQVQGTARIQLGVEARPYTTLPSGVSYREERSGKDDGAMVRKGSKVGTEMSIRCKSYASSSEPDGVKYYSTKEDTDLNDLTWTIGSGEFSAALEEGMLGMKKNSIRRIEVPSTQVFAARNAGQLPEATTEDGERRYENLFKTDATLLFEITVKRIN